MIVDDEQYIRLGQVTLDTAVSVDLQSQHSFGRVHVLASKPWRFECFIDFVPAPAAWELDDDAGRESYAHLNFNVKKIALSSQAHGVIGQTSRVKYDANGMPVLYAENKDGMGVIDGIPRDYELDDITSTDFAFSVFHGADSTDKAAQGFVEGKLNAEASRVFNV